jgi:CPA2 family monovalent cation:H+ antiporter-2
MPAPVDVNSYKDALILLGTAGVVVPLVHRLRISPILGFLAAGAVLGPKGLGSIAATWPWLSYVTVSSEREITWLAELGVVFLLFFVGLELSLPRFVTMRRLVFGLGLMQVTVTAVVLGLIAMLLFARPPPSAMLIGASLSLSSTAMVIEVLAQQNRLTTSAGRAVFSVLLLQDLAVVPLLFLAGILGAQTQGSALLGLVQALAQAGITVAVIVAAGWLLLRPLFRLVAQTRSHELFVAATLFVAVGTSVLTGAAGLSMALGAFIAGLLLAETEYRKAIEATVEPFKGLLLGVFFFSVGMLIDLALLARDPALVVAIALGLIVTKVVILIPLARAFGLSWPAAIESGLLIGPGGEFAFIVIGVALGYGTIAADAGGTVLTAVALTMAAIPGIAGLAQALTRYLAVPTPIDPDALAAPPHDSAVRALVVGHGRVGRLVCEMLEAHAVPYLATDRDPEQVAKWRRRGRPIYYGDAKQPHFLRRCGIEHASAVIVTIHAPAEIEEIVRVVRALRNDILIVSRARDAAHARHLYAFGVTDAVPETIEASLQLSEAVLVGLGVPTGKVIASIHEKRDEFRHDLQRTAGRYGLTTRAVKRKTRPETATPQRRT